MKFLIALLFPIFCIADTPPPGLVKSKTLDGSGTAITSSTVGLKQALDVSLASGSIGISGTIPVALTNQLGTIAISNFPGVSAILGTVTIANPQTTVAITNYPNSQKINGTVGINNFPDVQQVSGTVSLGNLPLINIVSGTTNIGNLPASQNINGTVTVSNTARSITNFPSVQTVSGTVSVLNSNGTVSVSNLPSVQVVSGTTNVGNFPSTQNISGTIACSNCSGGGGTSGTVAVSNFPSSQATTVTNGTITISNPQTSVSITGVVNTNGTQSISNFPASQAVTVTNGTVTVSNPISGFATSAKQDITNANLGTIASAVTNGTLNVLANDEILYGSLAVSAGSSGTIEIDISNGYSDLEIHNDQNADTGTTITWEASKTGAAPWDPVNCINLDALDGQLQFNSNFWRDSGFLIDEFDCNISTYKRLRISAIAGTDSLVLRIGIGKQPGLIYAIASNLFTVDYQWRTVGGDGVTPGPDGNPPTAANSKPVIQATDATPFKVQGTVACSNCSGSSSSGTTAISGTVPVSVVGVVVVSGTTQAAGTQQISGSVSLANIGTMAVSGIVPVSGSLAITTGTVYVNQLTSKWLVTSTEGTTSISNFPQIQPVSGSLAVTTGTIYANQLGTWSDAITGGTIQVVSAVTAITNELPAGTNLLGKTGIDQTTPGSTNGVVVNTGTLFTTQLSLSPVSVSFNESAAAPTAATWYKKRQWQVPSGSTFLPDKAKSTVTTAGSRTLIGTGVVMGSLNLSSNAFTDASAVTAPRFFSRMFGCVTTVMSATSDNLTVTYTDNLGNSHSTAATTFPASTPVGDCIEFPLAATTGQMTDTGFSDVTNITDSAAPTGIVEIIGMNTLHDALGAANAFELSTLDNSVVLQNEFIWILEMQAATTAQQRGASVEGAIRTP